MFCFLANPSVYIGLMITSSLSYYDTDEHLLKRNCIEITE
uniref:Uncharacterized protein n=1 Tax=Arundo donax TaxID=35708 RepID=A0A0A9FY24_ARUDO